MLVSERRDNKQMRYLLLTRGMPLCGKTTWIQQYHLEPYVLNPKFFRELIHSPMLDDSGKFVKVAHNDKRTYQMLFMALEARMERGDFIIIEDCHITKSYCSNYKEMAKDYAYKVLMVDFSNVPFETICARNAQTDTAYSNEELQALYHSLMHDEIPIKCDMILPDEIATLLHTEPQNLNGYKVIHHIGDIQGSYSVLQKYLGTMKNDEFYIFLGDYIDRGFQNYEVLQLLLRIMDKKNVCLLEGNHEKWLWEWANDRVVEAKEFRFNTQVELEQKGFKKHDARRLYAKLIPYFFYRFHDKRVICTHGGISNVPKYPILLSATQSIHGVGSYVNANNIAQAFAQNAPSNFYQVFGHRNKSELPICLYEKNFILESQVEFGGYLRTLQLNQHGFVDKSIRNTIFITKEEKESQRKLQKFFDFTRHNKKFMLREYGDFVSIGYPPKFSKDISELAYAFNPCIIDIKKWQIVGRGYHLSANKTSYFHTHKETILEHVNFPLHITKKLFGKQFLITYYNARFYFFKDSVLTTSLPIFLFLQNKEKQQRLAHHFKNQAHSLLFLQTSEHEVYLLNVFANKPQTDTIGHDEQVKIATILDIKTPDLLYTITNKEQFKIFMQAFNHYNMCIATSTALQTHEAAGTLGQQDIIANNQDSILPHHLQSQLPYDEQATQDVKALAFYVMQNITPTLLSGFCVSDAMGYFFEIPTFYGYEMQVITEFIKIWRMRHAITPLSWINNPLRTAFFQWIQTFATHKDWECMPTAWIQNAFLQDIAIKQANMGVVITHIPYTFKFPIE